MVPVVQGCTIPDPQRERRWYLLLNCAVRRGWVGRFELGPDSGVLLARFCRAVVISSEPLLPAQRCKQGDTDVIGLGKWSRQPGNQVVRALWGTGPQEGEYRYLKASPV